MCTEWRRIWSLVPSKVAITSFLDPSRCTELWMAVSSSSVRARRSILATWAAFSLRACSSDPSWETRETLGLQQLGETNIRCVISEEFHDATTYPLPVLPPLASMFRFKACVSRRSKPCLLSSTSSFRQR